MVVFIKDLLRNETQADKQTFFISFLRKFRRGNKNRLLEIKCACSLLEMSKLNENFMLGNSDWEGNRDVLGVLQKQ